MSNPTADYPTATHTITDVSEFSTSLLGATSPTHTELEGKQEEELSATQSKLGTGASTPKSGEVLYSSTNGASAWTNLTTLVTALLAVLSVNGKTGAVTLDTDDVAEGTTNVYHTATRVQTVGDARYLRINNNLSDLANSSTARNNLGLGSLAVENINTTALTQYLLLSGGTITGNLAVTGIITTAGIYSEIYVDDGTAAQSITNGTTYIKLTGFTTNSESSNCTADAANDKITFTKTGKYFLSCSINGAAGTPNVTFEFTAFLNNIEQNNINAHRKYASGGDNGSCSLNGILDVTTTNIDLDIRARHDYGSPVNFTPTHMTLTVTYIGET